MPIKFEIKIHVYFSIKQNKNSTRITEVNNISCTSQRASLSQNAGGFNEIHVHTNPIWHSDIHWTECFVYTLKYYWTWLCMHTHALMHTDMGYFPHKVDNISHHSADRGCMNILNGIVCLSNNWWHHIFSDPQLSASSVSRDCVLEALVHFLPGPLML